MKDYPEQLAELNAIDPTLATEISGLRNLETILRWAPGAGIPVSRFDLIQQDEYGFDLLLPLADSRWLAFGIT